MSNNTRKFALTCVAAGVILGLSGCSMVPVNPDSRLGRTTAAMGDVGGRVWTRTKHVFRISDDETVTARNEARDANQGPEDEFAEPVDLALMEKGSQNSTNEGNPYDETVVLTAAPREETAVKVAVQSEQAQPAAAEPAQIPLAKTRELVFRTDDYKHEVQADESLWDLSRNLTGDARNWRILAELNDLDENGTIYPGQTLHIPADMASGKGLSHIATVKPLDKPAVEESQKSEELVIASALPKTEASEKSKATDAVAEVVIADKAKKAPAAPTPAVPSTDFGVQAGETLWDLAKRTTGDATNWKQIAASNNMTESQAAKIRYGQNISVPNDLLKRLPADSTTLAANSETQLKKSNPDPVKIAAAETTKRLEVPAKGENGETAVASVDAEGKKIEIMPATFKSDPPKIPVAEESEQLAEKATQDGVKLKGSEVEPAAAPAQQAAKGVETNSDWVMVSGTYYPKAVYNDANFSATLLMRVSPGTKLLVSRSIGPWFEVKTDRGIGYVHSRDVR